MRIVAWTYDADYHCLACAVEQHPILAVDNAVMLDSNGNEYPAVVLDREGNECHPVFSWDEGWQENACGDCLEPLDPDYALGDSAMDDMLELCQWGD